MLCSWTAVYYKEESQMEKLEISWVSSFTWTGKSARAEDQ